jgi:hypothetical protein
MTMVLVRSLSLKLGLALAGLSLPPLDLNPVFAGAVPDQPLVVTQVPGQKGPTREDSDPASLNRRACFEGARLVLVSPTGQVRLLSDGFESACDPNVSFDGERLLFAGKRAGDRQWRIWEMGLDGQAPRAVSPGDTDAWSPIYVSTLFTLNSPEPWFTTVFVGAELTANEAGRPGASSLYNIKLDGTELRRLTFNPNRNLDPFQMRDGRVIYSAEWQPQEPGAPPGRTGLFSIHVEGADMELYGGETGAPIQWMPCATERGLVVFVESDKPSRDGAGQLACVEERRPQVTYKRLTRDPAKVFLYPSPWKENMVLVSQRTVTGQGSWGVVSMDLDRGQSEPVFDSPDYHDVQAVVVQPRKRPDGHSTVVNPKFNTGTFYGLNCYTADAMREAHLRPGSIKRVRLIEGVLQSPAAVGKEGRWPAVPRRLIGEAPVETDGSFNVEVPADTPLLLQTLDERGLALGTCGWIWVKPKETRGCIGCHEDPERVPENDYVLALRRPSNRLALPPPQRRSVSFREDVAPLLARHCAAAECHGGKDSPLRLPLTTNPPTLHELQESYATLMAPAGGKTNQPGTAPLAGRYVDAGRARTSWLIWQLAGQDTSRPWDLDGPEIKSTPREVKQMPPSGKGSPLREEEVRTLIQWIDLGAQLEAVKPPASPVTAQSATSGESVTLKQ